MDLLLVILYSIYLCVHIQDYLYIHHYLYTHTEIEELMRLIICVNFESRFNTIGKNHKRKPSSKKTYI